MARQQAAEQATEASLFTYSLLIVVWPVLCLLAALLEQRIQAIYQALPATPTRRCRKGRRCLIDDEMAPGESRFAIVLAGPPTASRFSCIGMPPAAA